MSTPNERTFIRFTKLLLKKFAERQEADKTQRLLTNFGFGERISKNTCLLVLNMQQRFLSVATPIQENVVRILETCARRKVAVYLVHHYDPDAQAAPSKQAAGRSQSPSAKMPPESASGGGASRERRSPSPPPKSPLAVSRRMPGTVARLRRSSTQAALGSQMKGAVLAARPDIEAPRECLMHRFWRTHQKIPFGLAVPPNSRDFETLPRIKKSVQGFTATKRLDGQPVPWEKQVESLQRKGIHFVCKTGYSAFAPLANGGAGMPEGYYALGDITKFLEESGFDTILLCGLFGSLCITSTARTAFGEGLKVIVLEDAVADLGQERQKAAFLGLKHGGIAKLFKTDQVQQSVRQMAVTEIAEHGAASTKLGDPTASMNTGEHSMTMHW